MAPTIRDVAKSAGVSISTVSLVINGGKSVSPAMYKRVASAIMELGYVPNPLGRALSLRRTFTLIYMIPTISNPFYSSIIQAVEHAAAEHGYGLIVRSLEGSPVKAQPYEFLNNISVDGALVTFSSQISIAAQYTPFTLRGIPVVSLAGANVEENLECVATVDDLGMQELTHYLMQLGHRRIAYIGRQHSRSTENRLNGIRVAMQEKGIAFRPEYIRLISGYAPTDIQAATRELLSLPERPTALACYNDTFAVEALRICAEMGFSVPGDITVTGHDDTLGSFTSPPLTTMRVPVEAMGRLATEKLIKRIEGMPSDPVQAEAFQPELVIRSSSGPCKHN